MSDSKIQEQINEINRKLDLLLEEATRQGQKREEVEDLVTDLSIIGKDAFTETVHALDNAGVELDYAALSDLGVKLIRNVGTFNEMISMLESGYDLLQDVSPIMQQMGLDAVTAVAKLEEKGYIDFIKALAKVGENVMDHFTIQDIEQLADSVVPMLETVKSITQPEMMNAMNNAVSIFNNIDTNNIEEYSVWRLIREMNSPEVKKGLGFMMTFAKNLSKESLNK